MEKATKKGVILCGGRGTRLYPATRVINKHLIPILNKPMVLYPLQTLKDMGIEDILLVSGGEHIGGFAEFLGDGSEHGINLTYKVQKEAGGIAEALSLAEDFVGYDQFAVILGDNMFEYSVIPPDNCGIVISEVADPTRFGVYDPKSKTIEEKPVIAKSKFAVTGLYFYTSEIFDFIRNLKPSDRGELEITDVNNWCLKKLPTSVILAKGFWSDMGTPDSLLRTANFIKKYDKA